MEFIDVVFPINLGPLTYKCPENLAGRALPGMLVSAPLKKQTAKGIILGKSERPKAETVKAITEVHGESPILEPPMLKLLEWMSDYYIANKGIVLKNMLPKEAFKKVKARKSRKSEVRSQKSEQKPFTEISNEILSKINESISKKEYRTFLFYAPSSLHEVSLASKLMEHKQNAIILVPEIVYINNAEPVIREMTGDKLCVLHSGLSSGLRSEAMEKIISGECSVVLGTRMAAFAPLKNVSLIAVMQEHSGSYKPEEGLRYSARDIAVMRGYLERATVVLSSVSPSIESTYNAQRNKYTLLKTDAEIPRPKIKIVNMHNEKKVSPNLSKTVLDSAASSISKSERIMFVINRKGYSMLTCRDCGDTEICEKCGIPLIFHKDDKSLRCHYCGFNAPAPERCRRCGSFDIELAGAGIQRIEEDIKRLLNVKPVRLDSDRIKRKSKSPDISEIIKGETLVLGTKLLTKRLRAQEGFHMAALLNVDSYLNLPDFRAAEKAYQEISAIADRVRPDGRILIQTGMPKDYLFRFIKNYDYDGFSGEELSRRKEMGYPPYSKMALITLSGCDENKTKELMNKAEERWISEILGPSVSVGKRGHKEYSLLFRASSRQKLYPDIKKFLKLFASHKKIEINVAVDP